MTNTTIPFSEIIDYAQNYNNKSIIEYDVYYPYLGAKRVHLNFTHYGYYVGSTIEKSNHAVLVARIKEVHPTLSGLYCGYVLGINAYRITIEGDLPLAAWQVILNAIATIELYPILDDQHYRDQQISDCEYAWSRWQYGEVVSELISLGVDFTLIPGEGILYSDILELAPTIEESYASSSYKITEDHCILLAKKYNS